MWPEINQISDYSDEKNCPLTLKSIGIVISADEHLQPSLKFNFIIMLKGFVLLTVRLTRNRSRIRMSQA
uniref:Putative ovule protein n=1 Tax=Solanum chacoense TaxID=4108 RepID=A0A0V0GL81_SOLCH